MIRAILFDIDNTLLDFHKCAKESMKKGFEDWEIPYAADTYEVYQSINTPLWREIEDGLLTLEELKQVRWVKVFDALGVKADGVAFETLFRKYLKETAKPVDGAYEILEYLNPNYRMYSASNGPYLQQLHRLEIARMSKYMSGDFISEHVGYQKPTQEYFEACFSGISKQLMDIKKDEILMVGDSLTADIAGGLNYGIQTCWYNHNKDTLEIGSGADYDIDHLTDLKKFL